MISTSTFGKITGKFGAKSSRLCGVKQEVGDLVYGYELERNKYTNDT